MLLLLLLLLMLPMLQSKLNAAAATAALELHIFHLTSRFQRRINFKTKKIHFKYLC